MQKTLKSYLITDPLYYTNDLNTFEQRLENTLENHQINFACFRDKTSPNFEQLASIFIKVCKNKSLEKSFINSDYLLAKKLKATGVHLNSKQFDKIQIAKDLGLYVIISCHNFEDIKKARTKKADAITYSPIFKTPNKGKEKGIESLKEVLSLYKDMNIIALGGIIAKTQIEQIAKTNAFGFASIRYFI